MLAEQHKEITDFITEYNKHGPKILSQYDNHNGVYNNVADDDDDDEDEVVDQRTRKVSITIVTLL